MSCNYKSKPNIRNKENLLISYHQIILLMKYLGPIGEKKENFLVKSKSLLAHLYLRKNTNQVMFIQNLNKNSRNPILQDKVEE